MPSSPGVAGTGARDPGAPAGGGSFPPRADPGQGGRIGAGQAGRRHGCRQLRGGRRGGRGPPARGSPGRGHPPGAGRPGGAAHAGHPGPGPLVPEAGPDHPPAPPPPAGNAKKGVGAWAFTGAGPVLAQSGASWYYTWSASPAVGVSSAGGPRFVPLIWGAANVNAGTLSEVRGEGPYLLGFNEPDMSGQANMTPAQALSLWPQLMATGLRLGSPAVATGGATPGGWLDQFMSGAAARGYRVNFITLHWYGSDFATGPAVSQLESYLQAVHARYHKPIWLTEFALASFGGSPQTPSRPQQAAFLTAATAMLQRQSYVQRYAWFGLEATPADGSMGLFRSGPAVTTAGRGFEAAG
ncbi:MAG: glycoside hydrolase family protein [Streptosporangiaceae bacterium]